MSADLIPPGGEGEIKVTLTPKPGQTKINKQVRVMSNDPEQSSFALTMQGELLIDMQAKPSAVAIREIKVGSPGTATFTLSPSPGSTAKVTSVSIEDDKNFSVKRVEQKPDGSEVYEVRFAGRDTPGNDSTRLTVKTTGENTPELTIPVNASSVLNLRFIEKIRFSYNKQGELQDRVWRLSAREGDAPKIKKVEDPDGMLDIEILPREGQVASLRMRPKPEKLEGLDKDARMAPHVLIVHTSDREQPKLELEYRMATEPRTRVQPARIQVPATATAPGSATTPGSGTAPGSVPAH